MSYSVNSSEAPLLLVLVQLPRRYRSWPTRPWSNWMPAVEAFQRAGKLVVQADLPGLQADDVTVEIDDGILTLSGERCEEHEVDQSGVRRTERRYGRFTRSIAVLSKKSLSGASGGC